MEIRVMEISDQKIHNFVPEDYELSGRRTDKSIAI